MQHDSQGIMLRVHSPIRTRADLNGYTLAVKPGSTWWEFIRNKFLLDQVHEIPATFSVADFLQNPNYIQQAFVTSEPYFTQRAGVATRILLNQRRWLCPLPRLLHLADLCSRPSRHRRKVHAGFHSRLARLHERSHCRQRHDRKAQSSA